MYARTRTSLYIILNTARYFRRNFGITRKAGFASLPIHARYIYDVVLDARHGVDGTHRAGVRVTTMLEGGRSVNVNINDASVTTQ